MRFLPDLRDHAPPALLAARVMAMAGDAAGAAHRQCPHGIGRVCVDLFGILSERGRDPLIDRAVVLGLSGFAGGLLSLEAERLMARLADKRFIRLAGGKLVPFATSAIRYRRERLLAPPDRLYLTVWDAAGATLAIIDRPLPAAGRGLPSSLPLTAEAAARRPLARLPG
ncbi:serine dehydratase beta chain [Chelatococcus sp. SYSU_G07232]|uniref:Serine dehydratase beta chain n=1 Tax=Chelatococcus albus TaxID=3047466 RepID=A0ABT7AIY6_9HYPH|nr:serine dehydratase beta chain [Chelatococcus sp. SYSU_G07232]MDJ1159345.1 serine dehydratase beta chain [Chelatococcus sp. SYSU_G07232]